LRFFGAFWRVGGRAEEGKGKEAERIEARSRTASATEIAPAVSKDSHNECPPQDDEGGTCPMIAQALGLALVLRFVTCISFAPAAFAGDALLPAVFLRLDISVSAGWLA
jgi:hypothetical protein